MIRIVETYTIAIDAHIAKGRLEAEGIPAFIVDEHYITMNWMASHAIGGVKLQVPSAYFDQAREVINALNQGVYEVSQAIGLPKSEPSNCPKCNVNDIQPTNWSWKLSFIALFFGLVFIAPFVIPFSRFRYKCKNRHQWIAREERGHPLYVVSIVVIILCLIITSIISFPLLANCMSEGLEICFESIPYDSEY